MERFSVSPDEMNEWIIGEFKKIAKVPRPTNYMEKISEYLYQWATEHGFKAVKDDVENVIFDAPASEGYENAPLTVLQAHMDMVCVAAEGKAFDKFNDPIDVVITDDGYLTADGTSLGGDDAIGVAIAMYCAVSDKVKRGPLRVIATVNEEGGSPSGAGNLAHHFVTEARYLINIDSEDYGTVTVSSCGFAGYAFSRKPVWEEMGSGKTAVTITLSGLKGGHSGTDINKNRANAIKAVNYIMARLTYKGVPFRLVSFNGGTGMSAIAPNASATIVIDQSDLDSLEEVFAFTKRYFAKQFDRTEAGYSFAFEKAPLPGKAVCLDDSRRITDLIAALRVGANTVSQRYRGITESSMNIGMISFNEGDEVFNLMLAMRTSAEWPVMLANAEFDAIARGLGFDINYSDEFHIGWVEKEGAVLPKMYAESFEEYTGDACEITAVHGGLECSAFSQWSDDIEIISVGPTIIGPHSTSEKLPIDTIGKTCGAIATLLGRIAEGK
ncbi:MAG: beta-Ala-His dipeptidase [Eubacteriales bacterium]|nr:beta-Ala-His dipeptidase [Eubacteriales bacterium]